jgi:hypothetical protein
MQLNGMRVRKHGQHLSVARDQPEGLDAADGEELA